MFSQKARQTQQGKHRLIQTVLKTYLPWIVLMAIGVSVLLMNIYCPEGHDGLTYAFGGQVTPPGECPRVASLMDIVRQQIREYCTPGWSGRVFVHGLTAVFAGFRLYTLFDILNTGMWFLFTFLILKSGQLRLRSPSVLLYGTLAVYWFLWHSETCSTNAAFAINYLWTATATLAMMFLWHKLGHSASSPSCKNTVESGPHSKLYSIISYLLFITLASHR